jgi:hypothetical protein
MEKREIEKKASEIGNYLQSAVTDVAYSMTEDCMSPEWRKRIKKAKRSRISDIQGWLADELYNDPDTMRDLVGDRIWDAANGNIEMMIAIAEVMMEDAHDGLKKALTGFIKDRLQINWTER